MSDKRFLIQLKGASGSGKSTIVSQFINNHNLIPEDIYINNKKVVINKSNEFIVIGRYTTTCGGCDGQIPNIQFMLDLFEQLMNGKQRVIIFEWMFVSGLYSFSLKLNDICESAGFNYIPVCLKIRYETLLNRVLMRTKKDINIDYIDKKINDIYRTSNKLARNKIYSKFIKIDDVQFEKMDFLIDSLLEEL